MLKWLAVFGLVAAAIAGAVVLVTMDLSSPVPVAIEQYQECQQHAREIHAKNFKCETTETRWRRTRDDPVSYYTLWLTGFTAVLAAVSIIQGVFLIRADRTARISADAAKASADAARVSAQALPNVERAHVFLHGVTIEGSAFPKEDGFAVEFPFMVVFKNLGKTPAIITQCKCGIVVGDNVPSFDVLKALKEQPLKDRAIAASGKFEYDFKDDIRGDWRPRPVTMPAAPCIFAVGYLMFDDIFDDQHEVGFCHTLDWNKGSFDETKDAGHLNYRRLFKRKAAD